MVTVKTCKKCNNEFPNTNEYFVKNGRWLKNYCKSCDNQRRRIWTQNNQEKTKTTRKIYKENNRDKIIASRRKYYYANKEHVNARSREYYYQNRERILTYYKENPEISRKEKRKRRALVRNNGHVPYTEQQVLDMFGTKCYLCNIEIDLTAPRSTRIPGWENGLHIDHVVPISNGGPDMIENVRPTHGSCNLKKHTGNKNV